MDRAVFTGMTDNENIPDSTSVPDSTGGLQGKITVKFSRSESLISLCEKFFTTFNADQHEPIALRLFYGKETVLTLYALDKVKQETSNDFREKLPVRKFKELISLNDLLPFLGELNFTLETGNFPLEDMEVINR
jgi:hypothetical protein